MYATYQGVAAVVTWRECDEISYGEIHIGGVLAMSLSGKDVSIDTSLKDPLTLPLNQ